MTQNVLELFGKGRKALKSLEFVCNQTYVCMNTDKKVGSWQCVADLPGVLLSHYGRRYSQHASALRATADFGSSRCRPAANTTLDIQQLLLYSFQLSW